MAGATPLDAVDLHKATVSSWGTFIACSAATCYFVADMEASALLTISVMAQCLAMVFLAVQVVFAETTRCISARSVALNAMAFACRLSSSTWLNGYLPVDASGDLLFQITDVVSLTLCIWLLWKMLWTPHRVGCHREEDSLRILPGFTACVVLAAVLHGDMDQRPLFDTLWMAGHFMSAVAVLPQLHLIKSAAQETACASHYVLAMSVGQLLGGVYMWYARHNITCEPWVEGVNHAVCAILLAHIGHLAVVSDFSTQVSA